MSENAGVRRKAKNKSRSSSSVPMSSDRIYNTPDPTGLISPPPEETLQIARTSTSKRKRTTPQPQQTTPNPKPRKQSRRPSVVESPTRPPHRSPGPNNPNADYLPTRTRRTTPIPAYEPPTDVFTPPRVVIMTPTISKSSKRKTTSRKHPELVIKIEPPQIDLSAPVSPPSPTDDPILLSAASSSPIRPRRRDAVTPSRLSLPPSSPPQDSTMELDDPHPVFDVTDPSVVAWSDSDDDDQTRVDEGEYTGRFRSFSVRTKLDPPSSATRERQEEWGRPITPFPFRRLDFLKEEDEPSADVDVAMEEGTPTRSMSPAETPDQPLPCDEDEEEERQVREMSLPLDDEQEQPVAEAQPAPESIESKPAYRGPFDFDASFEDEEAGPTPQDINENELPQDQSITMEETHEEADKSYSQDTLVEETPETLLDVEQAPSRNKDTDEEADEREVREMSLSLDDDDEPINEREEHEMSLFLDEEEPINEPQVHEMSVSLDDGEERPINEREEHEMPLSLDEEEPINEPQVREMSLSLDDDEGRPINEGEEHEISLSLDNDEEALINEGEDQEMSLSLDNDEEAPIDERKVREMSLSLDEEEAPINETQVREMSLSLDDPINERELPLSLEEPIAPVTPAPASSKPSHAEADEDSSSDEEELEYGVVKISSADPHAAARAAAILKQHDYDCFTKLALRAQKNRHSLSGSGITKTRSPQKSMRRRTLGAAVIGDKVFIPGSPATTLPELLKEAEAAVAGTPVKSGATPHLFTPVPRPSASTTIGLARSLFENAGKKRAWTKEEWKLLDACFTDERIALGPGDGQLASVDRVLPENVAKRFVDLVGGEEVVNKWGEDWQTENLIQRVKALQNKQRKGIVAPPTTPNTPRPSLTDTSTSIFTRRLPSMEVPDFTPLGRRAAPPSRRPTLPPPVVAGAPFSNLQDTPEQEQERPKRKLPLSLLAPRYSHLLEEAVAVSQLPEPEDPSNDVNSAEVEDAEVEVAVNTSTETEAESETVCPLSPVPTDTATSNPAPPNTLKNRVKGFLFSYLPTLSKNPAPKPKLSSRPGLPLPPPSVLEKGKSRGPITTPARAPMPKPTHPKELVHLNPAPAPPKPSLIPRPQKPQRLVELHRVSPPPEKEKEEEQAVIRPRRSSGGSVKDLVRGFEEMEKSANARRAEEEQRRGELKRVRSVGEWRKTAGFANAGGASGSKPSWRP